MTAMNAEAVPLNHRGSKRGEPTWELALRYPYQGEWTEAEYVALQEKRLLELSDGCLEFLPMPTIRHQLIVKALFQLLDLFVSSRGLGQVLFAPLPVRLWAGKYREPDILFLSTARLRSLQQYPEGMDLAIEVVSGDLRDQERDLVTKRQEYAAAGISEYWIVDPETRQITVLALDGKQYRTHGEFVLGMEATSVLLAGFAVTVDKIFSAGQIID